MQENNTAQLNSVGHALRTLAEWLISEYQRSSSGKAEPEAVPAPITTPAVRRLLNIDELATYLSIPKGSLYTQISTRKIPENVIVRFGRAVRFDIEAVDAWIEKNRSKN